MNLAIWDTAGQERFHALGPIYYRDADGAVLVYDTTDEESFHKVKNWVKELRKMVGQEIVLCIVGNKIDLDKERQVDKATAAEYAASVGALHCEVGLALNTPQGLAAPHAALAARASMRVKRLGRPSTLGKPSWDAEHTLAGAGRSHLALALLCLVLIPW